MTKEDLEVILGRRLFMPFRLHFSNGATHDVTHSDSILLSERVAAIAGDSIWTVAMMHIVKAEPLSAIRA